VFLTLTAVWYFVYFRNFGNILLKLSNFLIPAFKKSYLLKALHIFTLYSLRHTAICLRIINSEGKVNIFNFAKNAGTSVDQIERFYAKYLPLSAEMARNLQSFGD